VRVIRLTALLLALSTASGCATLLRRPQAAPTAPAPTDAPATAPTDVGPTPDSKPGAPPPSFSGPRPGELTDGEKAEWMRTLVRPDFDTLPLRWSPRVSRFLEQYKNEPRYRAIMQGWLRRMPAYRALMEEALVRHGLPRGLIFVAMIESGFSAGAVSNKAAGGFWQFIPDVARGYGLEVSFWIDERRDPDKSTEAAALYLEDLYGRFGSWELALAGYNAGVYAVLTSIARYNTNDYLTLCTLEAGLPWETTEYVPKVLAVAIVERNQAAFGFSNPTPEPPRKHELMNVGPGVSFDAIANRLGVSADEIAQLNPAYARRRTPPDRGTVGLRVPEGKARGLGDLGPGGDYVLVRVRPGETLARIARANRLARDRLRQINGVTDESEVTPGTAIFLPRTKKPAAATKPAGTKPAVSKPGTAKPAAKPAVKK
jgi:membrane-bound lytic murein transglycosylase D